MNPSPVAVAPNFLTDTLNWLPLSDFGIFLGNDPDSPGKPMWHSGHVNDVLSDGSSAIIATDQGGVWIINPKVDAVPQTNTYEAIPISYDWDNSNGSCLAYGPDNNNQVYAGSWDNPTKLYFVQLQTTIEGLEFISSAEIPTLPFMKTIWKIIVSMPRRILVIATDFNVWSGIIPENAADTQSYHLIKASGLPDEPFTGLEIGSNDTMIAAGSGTGSNFGIFTGTFNNDGSLNFTQSNISGINITDMRRTSLASCEANRNRVYASVAGPDDLILAILRSDNGGKDWHKVNSTPPNTGNGASQSQGSYNNTIDVSSFNPDLVAFGWRHGPFISSDGANTWTTIENEGNQHLHEDLHAVYFPSLSNNHDQLFVGSDGGLVRSDDLGQTFISEYNKHLNTLQFYGHCGSISQNIDGLVVGGTKDNGNLYLFNTPNAIDSFITLQFSDGGVCRFIQTGHLVYKNNVDPGLRIASWQPNTVSGKFIGGGVIGVDNSNGGLITDTCETVNIPSYSRNNQLMYAVAGKDKTLFGLFLNNDGTDPHWTQLTTFSENINALYSIDGNAVFIGTKPGSILKYNSLNNTLTILTINTNFSDDINVIVMLNESLGFAICGFNTLLGFDGGSWSLIPSFTNDKLMAIAIDSQANSQTVYIASYSSVFMSRNLGNSWTNVSAGLPRKPSISDLRIGVQNGIRYLYLFTFGYSVFRAQIPFEPVSVPKTTPVGFAGILFGVMQDGGGRTGEGVPVPPREPVREMLAGIAINEIARSFTSHHAHLLKTAALEMVIAAAKKDMKKA